MLILYLYRRKVMYAVEGRDIDGIGFALYRRGYIHIRLYHEGGAEILLDAIRSGHHDGSGAIIYQHGARIERCGVGLRVLIYHERHSRSTVTGRSAVIIQEIEVGRLQFRRHHIVRTVHSVREGVPYFLVLILAIRVIRIVFEDEVIHTCVEFLARQVLRQIPIELEEDDTLVTAVHRFLCRKRDGCRLTRTHLSGTTVRRLGDFDRSLTGENRYGSGTVDLGI